MEIARARWLQQTWLYLKRILIVNVVFLIIGTLWRLAFMWTYGSSAELQTLSHDVTQALILGARFDSTVLCYINSIPFLIWFLLSTVAWLNPIGIFLDRVFARFYRFLVPYYTVMLLIVMFVSAVDFVYYSFYQDRINVLIFGFFEDDTIALIKTIWRNYPMVWIFISLALFTFLLYKGLKINFTRGKEWMPLNIKKAPAFVLPVVFLTLFVINGIGARGGLALFPLSEMDTGISKSIFVNHLSFNGVRAFTRAIELKAQQTSHWDSNLKHFGYEQNIRQAFADFYQIPEDSVPQDPLDLIGHTTKKNAWAESTKPHVLVLVMESWGGYWLQYDKPEFDLLGDLKTHLQEDTYITNFLSSTNATIGSLSCLMIGAPQRPISEFLTESGYLQVPFRSSPARIFKQSGYQARFLYGGNPGWREVNKFALMQGFDTVEGETEIFENLKGPRERHDWGVYDEDLFDYVFNSLINAKTPQFMLTMTTTNHPPYQLPSTYKSPDLIPPAELQSRLIGDRSLAEKRFRTYRYSAQKLAEFLARVKNSPLKDKLVIAVTGDHTFWIVNFGEDQLLQKGSVPFYLYTPAAIRKKLDPETFGSHADILPTVYNLALSEKKYYALGRDLFDKSGDFAVNNNNLIVNRQGGVLVASKRPNDTNLSWEGNYQRLIPGADNPETAALSLKYKSLMGILDYYFMKEKEEKKGLPNNADTRR